MRVLIGDLLTGRKILDVPFLGASWASELNGPGSVTATVDLRDPDVVSLGMGNAATLGKTFLAIESEGRILEAGPIWSRNYDRTEKVLTLTGAGLWSYFDRRSLLPHIGDRPVVDPATGESAEYANSTWKNLHLGTIGKRMIEQSMTWPNSALPIVFEDDKPGDHERTYKGAELPVIGQMLQNLTEVENGPDIAFVPERTPDGLGVRWRYVSGDPRISSIRAHIIDGSVPGAAIDELTVSESASEMGALGWCSAGRSGDEAIIERAFNQESLAAGFPLMERVDSSRSSVSVAATALGYAVELARTGSKPRSAWSVSLHTGGDGEPRYTDYSVGDFVYFKIAGDPFIPDEKYKRRIVNMSGSAADPVIKLGLGEVYG